MFIRDIWDSEKELPLSAGYENIDNLPKTTEFTGETLFQAFFYGDEEMMRLIPNDYDNPATIERSYLLACLRYKRQGAITLLLEETLKRRNVLFKGTQEGFDAPNYLLEIFNGLPESTVKPNKKAATYLAKDYKGNKLSTEAKKTAKEKKEVILATLAERIASKIFLPKMLN